MEVKIETFEKQIEKMDEMMKIGLLTFYTAKNIGAQLQAFALFQIIKEKGHLVEFVKYEPEYLSAPYRFFRNVDIRNGILSVMKQIILHLIFDIRTWSRTVLHYRNFQRKYFIISSEAYDDIEQLEKSKYDLFIVGSDQIWNPEITNGVIDPFYTLNFESNEKRKVAYAASFSEKYIKIENVRCLIERLKSFNNISVRELFLKKYLEELSDLQIETVLDPTLLLNKKEWEQFISSKRLIKGKYVLLYQARGDKKAVFQYAKNLSIQLDATVYDASGMNYRIKKGSMQYVNPIEFLNLIKYAEAIVTVSFHGTALSIILEKPFYSILLGDGRDGRVESLLDSLDLRTQLKEVNDEVDIPIVDYSKVSKHLDLLRNTSLSYLEKALS